MLKPSVRNPARLGYNALGLARATHPTSCLSHWTQSYRCAGWALSGSL